MDGKRSLHAIGLSCCRWLASAMFLAASAAGAQTVYKCTARNGHVSYQDAPCSHAGRQQVLHLHDSAPAHPYVPTPAAAQSTPPPAAVTPPPPPPPPRIPQLYSCVRATDGKAYVSRNGHPSAYRVPLGILGAYQLPLASTYGGKDAPRDAASDPQLARGRITRKLIAGNYTWVQDRCRPMGRYEICMTLHDQLEKVEDKIRNAFRSDQPPLEKRAKALRRDMAGCAAR